MILKIEQCRVERTLGKESLQQTRQSALAASPNERFVRCCLILLKLPGGIPYIYRIAMQRLKAARIHKRDVNQPRFDGILVSKPVIRFLQPFSIQFLFYWYKRKHATCVHTIYWIVSCKRVSCVRAIDFSMLVFTGEKKHYTSYAYQNAWKLNFRQALSLDGYRYTMIYKSCLWNQTGTGILRNRDTKLLIRYKEAGEIVFEFMPVIFVAFVYHILYMSYSYVP